MGHSWSECSYYGQSSVSTIDPGQRLAQDLDNQIEAVSTALRSSVLPIVEDLVGHSHRPAVLARRLGIDKTLTGRIMRSVKAKDPFEIVHNAPAPYGLRIFLNAAAQAGVDNTRENQRLIYAQLKAGTHPKQILELLPNPLVS